MGPTDAAGAKKRRLEPAVALTSDEELARRLHEELNANVSRLSRRSSQQLPPTHHPPEPHAPAAQQHHAPASSGEPRRPNGPLPLPPKKRRLPQPPPAPHHGQPQAQQQHQQQAEAQKDRPLRDSWPNGDAT
ncbi:hypothetical protein MNEG_14433, partial [Monoraphidium neglectum]